MRLGVDGVVEFVVVDDVELRFSDWLFVVWLRFWFWFCCDDEFCVDVLWKDWFELWFCDLLREFVCFIEFVIWWGMFEFWLSFFVLEFVLWFEVFCVLFKEFRFFDCFFRLFFVLLCLMVNLLCCCDVCRIIFDVVVFLFLFFFWFVEFDVFLILFW